MEGPSILGYMLDHSGGTPCEPPGQWPKRDCPPLEGATLGCKSSLVPSLPWAPLPVGEQCREEGSMDGACSMYVAMYVAVEKVRLRMCVCRLLGGAVPRTRDASSSWPGEGIRPSSSG